MTEPTEVANQILLDSEAVFNSPASTLQKLAKAYNSLVSGVKEGMISSEQLNEKRLELLKILEVRFIEYQQRFEDKERSSEFLDDYLLLIQMLSICKYQIQLNISKARALELLTNDLGTDISDQRMLCDTQNSFMNLYDLAHMLLKLKILTTNEH